MKPTKEQMIETAALLKLNGMSPTEIVAPIEKLRAERDEAVELIKDILEDRQAHLFPSQVNRAFKILAKMRAVG